MKTAKDGGSKRKQITLFSLRKMAGGSFFLFFSLSLSVFLCPYFFRPVFYPFHPPSFDSSVFLPPLSSHFLLSLICSGHLRVHSFGFKGAHSDSNISDVDSDSGVVLWSFARGTDTCIFYYDYSVPNGYSFMGNS